MGVLSLFIINEMKTLFQWVGIITLLTFSISCSKQPSAKVCHIHGIMDDHTRDGKKIFLVPMVRPDSVGVDSTIIENGHFEFTTNKNIMAIVRVDLHSRYGTQDLLIVTEPGTVEVKIGGISSSKGTLQNDSLQAWKERTEIYRGKYLPLQRSIREMLTLKDTVKARELKAQSDSLHLAYKNYTRNLAKNLKEGILHEFLGKMFPKTYQRKLPDGTTITEDADKPHPL